MASDTTTNYKSALSPLAGANGYIPDDTWRQYVIGLRNGDPGAYQGLAANLVTEAGGIGKGGLGGGIWGDEGNYFINAAFNPFRSPDEWKAALAMNSAYRSANSQGGSTLFGNISDVMNPAGWAAREAGLSGVPLATLNAVHDMGSLGLSLLPESMEKMATSQGEGFEPLAQGIDRFLDPGGAIDTATRKAGTYLPESIRNIASTAGTVIGGVAGSYIPVIGTAAGAAIGRGIGGKLEGEEYGKGLMSSGLTYGSTALGKAVGGLGGTLSAGAAKTVGGALNNELLNDISGSGIDPSASATIRTSRVPETTDSVTSSAGSLTGDPETLNLSNLVQQLMQTASNAKLTNRASRYGLAARGLFPNRYSGLIGG